MAGLYGRFCARADRLASAAALEVALNAVARREGLPITALKAGAPRPRRIAALRHQALYIAVTHFGRPQRSVARAAGLSHEAVAKACRQIEELREDQAFERMMDELELDCMA